MTCPPSLPAGQGSGDGAGEAAARMVDCVEMAVMLPLEQGLAFERVCFGDLAAGEESLGLRHAAEAFGQVAFGQAGTGDVGRCLGQTQWKSR